MHHLLYSQMQTLMQQSKVSCNRNLEIMGKLVYVQIEYMLHSSIVDEFVAKFSKEAKKLTVGFGLEPDTQIGPLIDEQAYIKVESHIQDAVSKRGNN